MKDRTSLLGLVVMLLSAWPALAGGFDYTSGADQMSGMSGMSRQDSAMASTCHEEDADFDLLDNTGSQDAQCADARQQEADDSDSIAGNVDEFQTIQEPGETIPHVIARIHTQRGIASVDLGSADQVPPLRGGQFIQLRGFWGQVNNRNVFVTTRLNDGQRMVRIFVGPQRQDMRQIRGQVLGTYTLSSDQTGNQMRFARIRMDNGWTKAVNLGPAAETASLNLRPGDEIAAVGRPVGLLRFRAHEVMANGQNVAIDWRAAARGWAGQRLQQAGFGERR